ncbi:helicase SNF2 family protein [Thiohalobacter sp. COW1]|nr:helicase SNF2 family protein [Thiohalobacter sp. COW1]
MLAFAVPEPGQLVEVRRRRWVVGDVQGAAIDGGTEGAPWQHLVNLTSIDEDALGEELDVVWEIEPGARILEKAGLPVITGHDAADRLDAFLDAVSWGAATNADRSFLQAPFRSGVTIEDYQLDPLVRAIDMARVNILIADDVGLGKTIEAGLVIQELLVRHRARSVLVVCPASLQVKWQTEMHEKFGLEFRIVDTDYVKRLRRERGIHANPWTSFPRLVTSMDWMKSGEGLRLMKDVLPPHVTYPRKFDILVVDEAHNVAPAAATQYALESQRTRLIRTIAPHFEHRLFLSATPHNGYQESFTSLLELLDDQRFARSVMPDERQLQRVMVRRLKTDLVDADGKPIYPRRELMPLEIEYTAEEREMHGLLRKYTENRSRSVQDSRSEYGTDFVHKLLKKRLFSSPAAFAATLAKHRESLERGPTKKSGKTLEDRILRKAILRAEEDWADDERLEEALDDATREAGASATPLTTEQRDMLDRLGHWAESAKDRPDSKARAILEWLESHLKTDGRWSDSRVILFTEYRATHAWLHRILASHDYGGDRLAILHGGMDRDERERVKAAFQAHPDVSPVRILLATDAASEGIDLQNHCSYLVHIEIPWNPNVMEQRNGRIDRHGQKHDRVHIWHPVGNGFSNAAEATDPAIGELEGDHEYLMRAVLKVNAIREDLGSVGPVIAEQIEQAMLGHRDRLDTRIAEGKAERARRFVATERKLKERVAKLHERLLEARNDFHLSPDRISRTVRVALELAELPPLKPVPLRGAPEGSAYEVPWLPGSWGRATAGLEHPHTGARRPITFDHEVAKGRDDVVLAHLNHRLVQMCLRLLREQVWALESHGRKNLHRVTVLAVSDSDLRVPAVAVWSRLVITGGNHHRLHEELTLAGGEIEHGTFRRIPQVGRLERLVDAGRPIDPPAELFDALADRFLRHEEPIRASVEARSRDRLKYLENTLERRKVAEIEDLAGVLAELEGAIRHELEAPPPAQMELWPTEQRDQLRRDVEALRARLERIPEERERETAAIEARYAGLVDRTFPVAVVFLVPQSSIGAGAAR